MAFNLAPRANNFTPFCKFNAKSGRWYTKTDSGEEYEVSNMTCIFDLENIRSGWFLFTEGLAPDVFWDEGSNILAPPSTNHKRGFAVNVFSQKELGGLREFSSTSNTVIAAMETLYNTYMAAAERDRGLVPVVTVDNVLPVKSTHGVNYQPVFRITKWVPRPQAVPAEPVQAATAPAPVAAPVAATFGRGRSEPEVPPPVQRGTMQPAMADSEEF